MDVGGVGFKPIDIHSSAPRQTDSVTIFNAENLNDSRNRIFHIASLANVPLCLFGSVSNHGRFIDLRNMLQDKRPTGGHGEVGGRRCRQFQ